MPGRTLFLSLFLLFVAMPGCAADRPLHVSLSPNVRRPARAAVVFFIDGFGRRQFNEAIEQRRIPCIAENLYNRGMHVQAAVSCVPTITYANAVSFITGRLPGHHGIISNVWYDPTTGQYQNYCLAATFRDTDKDYVPSWTIYEKLALGHLTVSLQAAQRRGANKIIDNLITGGINWYFENPLGVDCLVAQDFEEIAENAERWRRWPDLIFAYLPALDHVGHAHGPESPQYKNAVANCDREIGRMCQALKDIGMYDRTYLCLVSDHGQAQVERDKYLDITELLRRRTGLAVWERVCSKPACKARLEKECGFALAECGSRFAAIYPLPGAFNQPDGVLSRFANAVGADSAPTSVELPPWLAEALNHPAVEMAACSFRPGRVHLFTRNGHAVVTRTAGPPVRHSLWQEPGREIFTGPDLAAINSVIAEAASPAGDSRAYLARTGESRYPDLVPQITALFDSPRAGNIICFAADGWDFSLRDPAGSHGSILADDMHVPMVFAGPGIPPGETIPRARNCDLAPTLLHLLGASPADRNVDMDGVDLLPFVDSARPTDEAAN